MKKAVVIIIAILVIGGAVGAFVVMNNNNPKEELPTNTPSSNESESHEHTDHSHDETEHAENQVNIEDFAFKPETITVKKGTTVTWTNKDEAAHTVTPDEEGSFEGSELLAQGESFSVTFDETGTFAYHCQPHPQMTATVVVTE